MYTGYFAKIKTYEKAGLIPIAICGGIPNWYKGLWYKKLAPKWSFFNEWKNGTEHKGDNDYYIQHFNNEVLDKLSILQVIEDLQKIANTKDTDKIILLCYEKPGDFCHRHLVADWLTKNGLKTIELKIRKKD
jgi:uncharacterized protein YeaO (DUF488 family)